MIINSPTDNNTKRLVKEFNFLKEKLSTLNQENVSDYRMEYSKFILENYNNFREYKDIFEYMQNSGLYTRIFGRKNYLDYLIDYETIEMIGYKYFPCNTSH